MVDVYGYTVCLQQHVLTWHEHNHKHKKNKKFSFAANVLMLMFMSCMSSLLCACDCVVNHYAYVVVKTGITGTYFTTACINYINSVNFQESDLMNTAVYLLLCWVWYWTYITDLLWDLIEILNIVCSVQGSPSVTGHKMRNHVGWCSNLSLLVFCCYCLTSFVSSSWKRSCCDVHNN